MSAMPPSSSSSSLHAQSAPRRPGRALIACTYCRRRKIRCKQQSAADDYESMGTAPCDYCQKNGYDCQYIPVGDDEGISPPTPPSSFPPEQTLFRMHSHPFGHAMDMQRQAPHSAPPSIPYTRDIFLHTAMPSTPGYTVEEGGLYHTPTLTVADDLHLQVRHLQHSNEGYSAATRPCTWPNDYLPAHNVQPHSAYASQPPTSGYSGGETHTFGGYTSPANYSYDSHGSSVHSSGYAQLLAPDQANGHYSMSVASPRGGGWR
ncbi:hypothetical protein CYLTODRAFT_416697 [Cylindrobasidium torrendii FP15055 ss-10]|uniref:Zn(2)-C6 fungal-type domain-containing protein n=1 Tax=Cylindrobasidium torrendii FP15055 ss-10 TaxID=1314674 RepID=A0A0D7BTT7_9AGAR|nr:hypothetical protein CYLTODRAFT_416697 [Cylindrobasidium torrendii FP15055 ss-10]